MYVLSVTYIHSLCKTSKKHSNQKATAPRPHPHPLRTRFSSAQLLQRFARLFPSDLIPLWLQSSPASFYERLFTPVIVLWYLVFQSLHSDHTLAQVLTDAQGGGADALSPAGKLLSARIKSTATTSYSDARQRFPLSVLHQALQHGVSQIRSWAQDTTWHGWNVILLDGSTVRLRPGKDISRKFSPHRHGGKYPYWCLMRVVVGFCLKTGVVMGATCASVSVSEQLLAAQLLPLLLPSSLIVGDSNFGVFSVMQAAVAAQAQALVRLTEKRAASLARSAGARFKGHLDLKILWAPTRHDQIDPKLSSAPVPGRLLALSVQRVGFRSKKIYLFTTLVDFSPSQLLELYGWRWQVELNLRFVKAQMELQTLSSKSAEMAEKEWLAGLLAYNLIRSLMVAAAAQSRISVYILSFTRTRRFLLQWLQRSGWQCVDSAAWQQLLDRVSHCRQPQRRKSRDSEPRAIRPCRSHFPVLKGNRAAARAKLKRKS